MIGSDRLGLSSPAECDRKDMLARSPTLFPSKPLLWTKVLGKSLRLLKSNSATGSDEEGEEGVVRASKLL